MMLVTDTIEAAHHAVSKGWILEEDIAHIAEEKKEDEQCFIFIAIINFGNNCFSASNDTIPPRHKVTLREAHIGDLEIDTKLLDSYWLLPENIREFYLSARAVFEGSPDADFTNTKIIEAARKYNIPLMGGPMLGNLNADGVILWMRPSTTDPFVIKVTKQDGSNEKSYVMNPVVARRGAKNHD
jgi:alkaline phosphatase D